MPSIKILKPGLLTSVQDAGRYGYEHLGVMVGGWMDDFAARWANRLVGNPLGTAVLEITLMGPTFEAQDAGWLALAGADLGATVNDVPWQPGSTRRLDPGDCVSFGRKTSGMRGYLSFAGGLEIPAVLASQSTDLVAGFGGFQGRALAIGDELFYVGSEVEPALAPVSTCILDSVLHVLPGVRHGWFKSGTWEKFLAGKFRVDHRSNRVGLRLTGTPIVSEPIDGDQVSEAIAIGSVEVTPSGELLVLTKSRGSIGGYPTLAHVVVADWPILAQLVVGQVVSFVETDESGAACLLRQRERELQADLVRPG